VVVTFYNYTSWRADVQGYCFEPYVVFSLSLSAVCVDDAGRIALFPDQAVGYLVEGIGAAAHLCGHEGCINYAALLHRA